MGWPDPFALTPDTSAYVPREATERALAALGAAVQRGEPALLVGAAGVGKTLLLHLLAERAGPGLRAVYVPNPRLEPSELCAWVASGFGAPPDEDPSLLMRAWLGHLRAQEQACLLLVDDVDAMPEATLRWLAAGAAESRGALRLALASLDGPAAARVSRALGSAPALRLDAPLSAEESAEYVAWRLRHANAPEALRARFDAAALADLQRVSAGNPRRLHLAALAIERGRSAAVFEDELEDELADASRPAPAANAPAAAQSIPRAESPSTAAPQRASPAPPRRRLARTALLGAAAALAAALAWWLLEWSPPERRSPDVTDAAAEATSADVGP
jgi:MSHA biogenesis protein MshM